jgi:hypothetical protein
MKHSIVIIAMLGIVSSVAFASLEVTDPKAAANATPLPEAYGHAMTALGSATNELHCTSAHLVTPVEIPSGIWYFDFCSTNGAVKIVEVFTESSKWNTKVTDRPVATF